MKTNPTTILCYGDSNTYGYDPRSYLGSRYPKEIRWTGCLQQKFDMANSLYGQPPSTPAPPAPTTKKTFENCPSFCMSVKVKNLGVPGREIPRFEYEMKQLADKIAGELSGLHALQPKEMCKNKCLSFKKVPFSPLQLWIMLGTNDLLNNETITAGEVAARMETFLDYLMRQEFFSNGQLMIRLIAPPKMRHGTWVTAHALAESARLGDRMNSIVPAGVAFTDAGLWELPVCFDGVHLTEEGHRIFAEKILKTAFI